MITNDQAARLAIIALGSNLGDSGKIIRAAMDRLEEFSGATLLRSSLIQTTPVDCPPGSPNFVNAAVGLLPLPGETAESLLARLQRLETEFGRLPKQVRNEARPLDLDLIAFRAEIRTTPTLTLPHPRAHLRRFVLEPLAEIVPELILPRQGKSVKELLVQLQTDGRIERLND